MCGEHPRDRAAGPTPFEEGLAALGTGRRRLLQLGGGLAFSTALGAAGAQAAVAPGVHRDRRVYVLVTDGCRPDEIDSGLTPNLQALRDGGLRYARASSLPIMETIPNHVMMMSGVRPDRSGVPANAIYDRAARTVRDLDRPSDLRADTVLERARRQGLRTGTVLSKEYLYGIFGTRATARWEPAPIIPVSEHAPDVFTMNAALAMLADLDPHLMFVNLGDIDRLGHSDLTGPLGLKALRRTALLATDTLIGRFVDTVKAAGHWERSLIIVLADHSMDWSRPDRVVSLAGPLAEDPLLAGKVEIADNGGADLLYWTGPARQREEAVRRMRRIAARVEGVESVHDRRASWLRLGPEAGDVVAFCEAGWRFSDPNPLTSNPIPGNHGHLATRPIPLFLAGGHPAVPRGRAVSRMGHTVDVAPTVASFLGLRGAPRGGWDGRALL
ncbi:alkaline phosphatase family protein [Nocardioides sp.]|uniref:alkaline phosphatase family protein n=1 Tax=Nocardioides sp. TaxID=35761 RepID=UPI003511EB77